jgi:uncharacterized protein (DUF2147 family)
MKKLFILTLVTFSYFQLMQSQVTGLWKSTDHIDDTERSVVEIYERNGKYYGRVQKLLPAATVTHCTGCDGAQKNKSIIGMIIMSDIIKNSDGGTDGKILDPTNGKWYSCDIELVSPDKLKVIGYIGFPLLGKTMYWKRLK